MSENDDGRTEEGGIENGGNETEGNEDEGDEDEGDDDGDDQARNDDDVDDDDANDDDENYGPGGGKDGERANENDKDDTRVIEYEYNGTEENTTLDKRGEHGTTTEKIALDSRVRKSPISMYSHISSGPSDSFVSTHSLSMSTFYADFNSSAYSDSSGSSDSPDSSDSCSSYISIDPSVPFSPPIIGISSTTTPISPATPVTPSPLLKEVQNCPRPVVYPIERPLQDMHNGGSNELRSETGTPTYPPSSRFSPVIPHTCDNLLGNCSGACKILHLDTDTKHRWCTECKQTYSNRISSANFTEGTKDASYKEMTPSCDHQVSTLLKSYVDDTLPTSEQVDAHVIILASMISTLRKKCKQLPNLTSLETALDSIELVDVDTVETVKSFQSDAVPSNLSSQQVGLEEPTKKNWSSDPKFMDRWIFAMLKAVVSEDKVSVHTLVQQVIGTLLTIRPSARWRVSKTKVCIYLLTHVIMCLCKYFTAALDLSCLTSDQIVEMVEVLKLLFYHYRRTPDSSRELYLEIIWSLCVLMDANHYSPSEQFLESVKQELAASFYKDSYVQCLDSEQRWHANLVTALFISMCRTVFPGTVWKVYTPLLQHKFQVEHLHVLTPQPTLNVGIFQLIQDRYGLQVCVVPQIQQFGVFAKKDIKANYCVGFVTGKVIDLATKKRIYPTSNPTHLYELRKDKFLDTIDEKLNPLTFLNHSGTPNCFFTIHHGRVRVYSKENISRHEQLSIDYGKEYKGKQQFIELRATLPTDPCAELQEVTEDHMSTTHGMYSIVSTLFVLYTPSGYTVLCLGDSITIRPDSIQKIPSRIIHCFSFLSSLLSPFYQMVT